MPAKTIMSKDKIATDPGLCLIKAFRLANKRAGEAKQALMAHQAAMVPTPEADDDDDNCEPPMDAEEEQLMTTYKEYCTKMEELGHKAEELNFHIWVNANGKTGHTYAKDYKPTSTADNNYELHIHRVDQMRAAVSDVLGPLLHQRSDDSQQFSLN
jgi:hypothetical protein